MANQYNVRAYGSDRLQTNAIVIEAEDAQAALRLHPDFRDGGSTTCRLGGPEFQAHMQFHPATGRTGIEAIHTALTPAKVKKLDAVRLHEDRRKLAFDLVHNGQG